MENNSGGFQCELNHMGHLIDEFSYNSYRTNRNLDEADLDLLAQFTKVGAKPKNVANLLSEAKNANYTTKLARNLMDRVKQKVG